MRAPIKHLADILLGEPVDNWIAARKSDGWSLRDIASELERQTNGRIRVSHQTVANWLQASRAGSDRESA